VSLRALSLLRITAECWF